MDDLPPINDPRWAEWTAPLLEYLRDGPRTWAALEKWRKGQRVSGFLFRNYLAWLEEAGVAQSEGNGARVRWMGRKLEEETDDGNQVR